MDYATKLGDMSEGFYMALVDEFGGSTLCAAPWEDFVGMYCSR